MSFSSIGTYLFNSSGFSAGVADSPYDDLASSSASQEPTKASITVKKLCENKTSLSTKALYAASLNKVIAVLKQQGGIGLDEDDNLILPMRMETAEIFFGYICDTSDDEKGLAHSTVNGYWNAINDAHRKANIDVDVTLSKVMREMLGGYKKVIAQKKHIGVMEIREGKVSMPVVVYKQLCKRSLLPMRDRTTYACTIIHLFMVLCWNMFARSCSVGDLRTAHFAWNNDALVIRLGKHKGDQAGESVEPKYLFANPFAPEICPVLAMGLYVFTMAARSSREDQGLLFLGKPYDVMRKWLPENLEYVQGLGHEANDFGTHSFRKGVTTHAAGFICGPSMSSIFLRAGWSLGQVQQRYIAHTPGGDQFCGRVASGLTFARGSDFCVLPPHFEDSQVLTDAEWKHILPRHESYENGFKSCLPFFLASVVYHWDWISAKDGDGKCWK